MNDAIFYIIFIAGGIGFLMLSYRLEIIKEKIEKLEKQLALNTQQETKETKE